MTLLPLPESIGIYFGLAPVLGRALWLALVLLPAAAARADAWVVVPVIVGGSDDVVLVASRAAPSLGEALVTRTKVLDAGASRERFETHGSSAPMAASHADIDELARDAQQALYHVAMGAYSNATTDVARVMQRADRALESLNRESMSARQLLDACLFIVRARLDANKRKEARIQANECRRLVPDIEPDPAMHPPNVIGELAAAEAERAQQSPGSLRVTSEPNACPVFIQGRNLGQTPLELPRLTRGEYRVQVECVPGEYGRVHRVTLGPSRTTVHVDSHFDAAVQSSNGVSLRYATEAASHRYAGAHAVEVGRVVGVRLAALVMPDPHDAAWVQVSALEVEGNTVHAVVRDRVGPDGTLEHATKVAEALVAGQSLDFTQEPPVGFALEAPLSLDAVSHAPADAATAPSPGGADDYGYGPDDADAGPDAPVLGYALGGAGLAGHIVGYALYAHLLSLDADYRKVRDLADPAEGQRRLSRIESFEHVPTLTGFLGAGLLAGSLPLWLPESGDALPLGALVTGSAGVVLAGAGAYFLIDGAGCDRFDRFGRCDDAPAATRVGAMLLSTALPLLAVPVVYLVRGGDTSASADVMLEVSARGAALWWRGTL